MISPVRSNPLSQLGALQRQFDRAAAQVGTAAEGLASDQPATSPAATGGAAGIASALVQMDTAKLAMLGTLKMAMKSNEAVASLLSAYGRES